MGMIIKENRVKRMDHVTLGYKTRRPRIKKRTKSEIISEVNFRKKLFDRDLGTLLFNERVLDQTRREDFPLYERLKYFAIVSSNLNEFIRVRYGKRLVDFTLKKPIEEKLMERDVCNVESAHIYMMKTKELRNQLDNEYMEFMEKYNEGVFDIYGFDSLCSSDQDTARELFLTKIYPMIGPIGEDEIEAIDTGELFITVKFGTSSQKRNDIYRIDPSLSKVYSIYSEKYNRNITLVTEDLIRNLLGETLQAIEKKDVTHVVMCQLFRTDAHSSIIYDPKVENNVKKAQQIVELRNRAEIIYVIISRTADLQIRNYLKKALGIRKKSIFKTRSYVDYSFINKLGIDDSRLRFETLTGLSVVDIVGKRIGDIYGFLKTNRDLILHHPYDKYDTVVDFIRIAATNKNVVEICMTLYRGYSEKSPIIEALCQAASGGVHVVVVVEPKARFDEDVNVSIHQRLESAGCRVICSPGMLKVHAKMCLLKIREDNEVKRYLHIGTGNYNPVTACIYEDYSLFTSNPTKVYSVERFFRDAMSEWTGRHTDLEIKYGEAVQLNDDTIYGGNNQGSVLRKHVLSMCNKDRVNQRTKMLGRIGNEIKAAKAGKTAIIVIKVNTLSDIEIIKALYRASRAGVKIYIICRGACSMRPINNNIVIKSVVGRFLEHSRVYHFHNGSDASTFISSSDILPRNYDRRYEIMMPLRNSYAKIILKELYWYLLDTENSYMLDRHGNYRTCRYDVRMGSGRVNKTLTLTYTDSGKFDVVSHEQALANQVEKFDVHKHMIHERSVVLW